MDKQFTLYITKTELQRRMLQGVTTQFENANIAPWITRLHACNSIRAVAKLRAEFEAADQTVSQ